MQNNTQAIAKNKDLTAEITRLSHDGRGVAYIDGKITFIHGALPGENIVLCYIRKRARYDEADTVKILSASSERVAPKCAHYSLCGACNLQHLNPQAQIKAKQNYLLEQLQHIANIVPDTLFEPISGAIWGYRRKARIGVRYIIKKDSLYLGFREKLAPRFLTDISHCQVLHPSVGQHMHELKNTIATLDACREIPQIEVAIGDNVSALIFRHLIPLSSNDSQKLCTLAEKHQWQIYSQSGGVDTIKVMYPCHKPQLLNYHLDEYNISLQFQPTDFIQVHGEINQKLIAQAIALLELEQSDQVLDLFCGIGNFTLPIAKHCHQVIGVEGEKRMVMRTEQNAMDNNIHNCKFYCVDLYKDNDTLTCLQEPYNKVLLDPPRSGAQQVIKQLNHGAIKKIVYVSCEPSTLARDTDLLVREHNYRLTGAGIINMFAHTKHVESIAVFTK